MKYPVRTRNTMDNIIFFERPKATTNNPKNNAESIIIFLILFFPLLYAIPIVPINAPIPIEDINMPRPVESNLKIFFTKTGINIVGNTPITPTTEINKSIYITILVLRIYLIPNINS